MNNPTDNQLLELSLELAQSVSSNLRFDGLLTAIRKFITCDAIVLLVLKGEYLQPLALQGLSRDTMGRQFIIAEHPRFLAVCQSTKAVRFAANSELPDPYDGLVLATDGDLPIHACMGVPLYFEQQLIGVLTLDSLTPEVFESLSQRTLSLIASMASISLHTALTLDLLEANVKHSKEVMRALNEPSDLGQQSCLVGQSAAMEKLKNEIALVAPSNYSILIQGESGTGKELVAHSIHQHSSRCDEAIIHVNCAALPENLIESELFGHAKGAFTGAAQKRAGKFLIANGGTIFLDEVGELPLAVQSKLLRVLQSNEIQPLGYDSTVQVDVRVIAATNRDLKAEVEQGHFRADLYHRLNVYPLTVPPLRDREGDIELLAGFFIERIKRKLGVNQLKVAAQLMERLEHYTWPGNVRELEHLLSRAALKACAKFSIQERHRQIVTLTVSDCDELTPNTEDADESQIVPQQQVPEEQSGAIPPLNLRAAVDDYQKALIKQTLHQYQGNWSQAAKHLGVDRANLVRLSKRLGIRLEKVVW
ncbi:nitric oxide reductase transcriptional regulator NorR [Pseudoalteromonas sp. BDTF-M6]|uniref:nitric oxide reductase transcriptional regulator NorR n=1 Tax=Pseudoalteromonas sp. BDTF-M6 TaxID=2796132 RepID=UPI001BAF5557|nr:nitric oxide reductase transcriptional regulator NorR [Pseudoalteromonas sp. BDTF-M6]MBS3799195.1 nitric oxide reductase transcriptional regulator NorR [Pseudoalteromonas sp. BDTF-M6]